MDEQRSLLSHHSSNPLELGSSDVRNNSYNKRYRASLARNDDLFSDDPIEDFTVPENVQNYQDHISRLYPHHPAARTMRKKKKIEHEIDDDMSEDELATPMKHCRHVSQLITATRYFDQVVLIMPYHRNEDFRVSRRLNFTLVLTLWVCRNITEHCQCLQ